MFKKLHVQLIQIQKNLQKHRKNNLLSMIREIRILIWEQINTNNQS